MFVRLQPFLALSVMLPTIALAHAAQRADVPTADSGAQRSVGGHRGLQGLHGRPGGDARPDRVVRIGPHRRYLAVTHGETVLFVAGARSFAWTFDPLLDHRRFGLQDIAPADVEVHGVEIYCVPVLQERHGTGVAR